MFSYDEKRFFNTNHIDDVCPPRVESIPQKVEATSRLLRDTLDRLMMFEKTLKDKYDDLFAVMTQDNVTFKNLMQDAYSDFVSSVRSEINLFETNTDGVINLFKESINARLQEFNENFSESFANYQTEIEERFESFEDTVRADYQSYQNDIQAIINQHIARFDTQDAKISDAVAYMKTNLNVSIENLLNDMQDSGELIGILDSTIFSTPFKHGAAGDGVTNDRAALEATFALPFVVLPKGTYYVGETVVIPTTCKHIIGVGAVIKGESGLDYKFTASGNEDLIIEGITFDSANVSRGGIKLNGCKNVTIRNCSFTGYTDSNGHSNTDSQINNLDSTNTTIDTCRFYDNGANANSLNRCITHDGDICKVINCTFTNVNQAIAGNGSDLSVIDCYMSGVTDNCIYCFANSRIANNYFNSKDEAVVVSGSEHVIEGNTFYNVTNKSIAICGDAESVVVNGNVFRDCNNVFITRDKEYTVNSVQIVGNVVNGKARSDARANMIYLPGASRAVINDNIFNVNYSGSNYYAVIGIESNIDAVVINSNTFDNDGTTNNASVYATYGNASVGSKTAHSNSVSTTIFDNVNNRECFYYFDLKPYAYDTVGVNYAAIYTLPHKVAIAIKITPVTAIKGATLFGQFLKTTNALGIPVSASYIESSDKAKQIYLQNGVISVASDETLESGVTYTFYKEYAR